MQQKIDMLDLYVEEIEKIIYDSNQGKYRAKQIFQWIHKGVKQFDDMTDISKALRQKLQSNYKIGKISIKEKLVSAIDGTQKYVMELEDSNIIESVLMRYKHGLSACISSQVGCKMGCNFCASGGLGFVRNLTPGEMIDQIITMQKDANERISNVVIMGIGEPLDNYRNVVKFLRLVNHPLGLNIGLRQVSLSTCGLAPQILQLAKEGLPVTLSVSLHAPNDIIRSSMMPIAKRYSLDEIINACNQYAGITRRRITYEYAMIAGVNDSKHNALELASKLKGGLNHVNLIPVNETGDVGFRRSSNKSINEFKSVLESKGVQTTIRRELGRDIKASCGQLRRRTLHAGNGGR